jgi:signal transduction histidine kinase
VVKTISPESGFCLADKDQLRQVFWNILLNAVQAMPGGGRLTISADFRLTPQQTDSLAHADLPPETSRILMISIEDNGRGISEDQLPTIFDPFVSHREGGVGLGLSIVHQILKLHRVQISVSSTVNQGTVFTLTFPCIENR